MILVRFQHFLGAIILFLSMSIVALSQEPPASIVDPETLIGKELPQVQLIDDLRRTFALADYRGKPILLLPMYTSCQRACLGNVEELKKTMGKLKPLESRARIVLFSFDSRERPESLHRFREKEQIPQSWSLVTSDEKGIRELMNAIAFQYADENGQYMHPNRIAFITSNLKIARFVYGSRYPAYQITEGIRLAENPDGADYVSLASKYLLGILIFLVTGLGVYLTSLVLEWKRARQALKV